MICPHCGGAIQVAISAQLPTQSDAIPAQNGQVAQGSKDLEVPAPKNGRQPYNQDYPAQFLEFWELYPRHRDKRKALIAWRKAIRRGAIDEINSGAIRYRNDPNRVAQFTKYAEGWLNADGWLDEPLPPRGQARMFGRESAAMRILRSGDGQS